MQAGKSISMDIETWQAIATISKELNSSTSHAVEVLCLQAIEVRKQGVHS